MEIEKNNAIIIAVIYDGVLCSLIGTTSPQKNVSQSNLFCGRHCGKVWLTGARYYLLMVHKSVQIPGQNQMEY